MLQLLRIQDFILIDLLEVSFASGFTSITGETGAGKSIFVGALSMLQGRRADSSLVKAGAKRSVIEATFVELPACGGMVAPERSLDGGWCLRCMARNLRNGAQ